MKSISHSRMAYVDTNTCADVGFSAGSSPKTKFIWSSGEAWQVGNSSARLIVSCKTLSLTFSSWFIDFSFSRKITRRRTNLFFSF